MPTVLRWGRYRAFSIQRGTNHREAKVWLSDLTVAVNFRFPAHELSDIIRHLETHSEELLDAWNDYFGD
ncbi:MAG: DUF4160 domain-containing protein [Methyloceanibacter sp.]